MKKKIILKINQKGMMFNLAGKKFRSPCTVDISHMKIDPIISQMRSYGITDFEILTYKNKDKNDSKTKIIVIENRNDDINKLNCRIEKLEYKLHELLNKNECNEKKEWEQNNKDVVSLSFEEKDNSENNELNKKPIIEEIINKPEPKIKNSEEIKIEHNPEGEPSKKIIIEELEEIEDIDIELEPQKIKKFKIKDFHYEEIKKPFELSPDIEKLKNIKN